MELAVFMSLTPERARLLGRLGAYAHHSRHDARESTAAARAAFVSKFEREVDPTCELEESERLRRAECARKAHFARLALLSADARRRKRNARTLPHATNGGE